MNILQLPEIKEHKKKIGKRCDYIEPNVTEDTLFFENGCPIGFYKKNLTGRMKTLLNIIDIEFNSDNVKKSLLERSDVFDAVYRKGLSRKQAMASQTIQMSAILGAMLPKAHMKRPYPCISAVHRQESAKNYIKAMLMASYESEKYLERHIPDVYYVQKKRMDKVPKKFKFGNLFTSTISNYNIAAPFHKDNSNIKKAVNVIMTKRKHSKGGCLVVPDYDITIECADNSMLVYPAWKNVHGVTPILPSEKGGYRNSHILYALKGFEKYGKTKET